MAQPSSRSPSRIPLMASVTSSNVRDDIYHFESTAQLNTMQISIIPRRNNTMKTLRSFTILMLAVLVLSSWAPAPVYAKSESASSNTSLVVDLAAAKLARLRVNNRTGGTLYVRFSGERGYSFAASSQGRTTFESVTPEVNRANTPLLSPLPVARAS